MKLALAICGLSAVSVSPAVAQYAYVGGAGLSVIDTATNKVVARLPSGAAAISPDGAKVYADNSNAKSVDVIDPGTNQVVKSIPVGAIPGWIAWTPDSRTAYVAQGNAISVLDAGSDSVKLTIPSPAGTNGLAVSPDGSKVYATVSAGFTTGSVLVISTSSNTITKTLPLPSLTSALIDPLGLDFTPDGTHAYIADTRQGILFVMETATDSLSTFVPVSSSISCVAVSPDGSKAYVSNFLNFVSVLRTSDNTILKTIQVGGNPMGLAFTPDGAKVYVANRGTGSVNVIDTVSDTLATTIATDNQPTGYGVFIAKRRMVAAGPAAITSVGNGFSGATGAAPGSFVSIYGTNLASGTASFTSTLPTSLMGTSVQLAGQAVPLYYVSPTQINVQIPTATALGPATLTVTNGIISASLSLNITAAAPGIPYYVLSGVNRAAARNQDNSINGPTSPAAAQSVMTIYLTGIGAVDNAVPAGQPTPNLPLSRATLPVMVTVGGQLVAPTFTGLTPGSIGLAQVNIAVPSLPTGDYPVVVTVNGTASNAPVISIK